MKKKVAFYTLGCKVNFCETESLQALFEHSGCCIADFEDRADIYIINTCTVTGDSDHKSRKAIRRARLRAPEAIIIATGCYAQGAPDKIREMEQVDLIIGNQNRGSLPQIVESFRRGFPLDLVSSHQAEGTFEMLPPTKQRGRTRGFLKIQDGCNEGCSYCIVPQVRGLPRSLSPSEVLLRAKILIQSGCREIVLTGIHLGLYGADLADVTTLAMLLQELELLPGLLRLRLSSLEPTDVTVELVEQIVRSSVICPHLHIPIQSGDSEILRLMNRPYAAMEYLYLAKWLKQEIPGLALSSDVIVGFPGETEQHHRRSMSLIKDIGFSRLHVFKYSSRTGTQAAGLPGQLPREIKEKRSKEMIALGSEMASAYRRQFIGSAHNVLIEKVVPYVYGEGFTAHYLRVKVATQIKGLHWRGKLVNALMTGEEGNYMLAEPCRRRKS